MIVTVPPADTLDGDTDATSVNDGACDGGTGVGVAVGVETGGDETGAEPADGSAIAPAA